MPTTSPCFDAGHLERLLGGCVSAEELERCVQHLEECPRCAELVDRFLRQDTLLEAARPETTVDEGPEAPVVRRLIDRVRDLRSPSPSPGSGPYDFLAPPEQPDEIGRLGGYRVLKMLGAGGMGIVFLAEDPRLKRTVALKVMKPDMAARPRARQRFLREAQAAAAVKHDNVVTIYQVGEDRSVPFLAMELLQGEGMDQWLGRGRKPSVPQVLRLGREIARGLAAAHEKGLIHRDVKPANIWLEAPTGRVKLLDFGLARAAVDTVHLTQSGSIVGTPTYMAPEQARGGKVDHRCDLFSLGCILYRLCTGLLPFPGDTPMAVLSALASVTPQPVQELNGTLPRPLADLIMRLLAKDPAQRPQTAAEVVRQLQAIERGLTGTASHAIPIPPTARPLEPTVELPPGPAPTPSVPLPKPATVPRLRRRWPLASVAAAVLLGVLGVGTWLFGVAIIRFATNQGELVVQIDDPKVEVVVKQNGVVVEDQSAKRSFVLTATGGEIEVFEKDGVKLTTKKFTLTRGGKTTVTLKELSDARDILSARNTPSGPKFMPLDPAWLAKVRAMKPEDQVQAVAEELKRRNPSFDGQLKRWFRDGKVVSLAFVGTAIHDLAPLQALLWLEAVDCAGRSGTKPPPLDLTQLHGLPLKLVNLNYASVSDLTPLRAFPLRHLVIGNTPVTDLTPLQGMSLESFNCVGCGVTDLTPLKRMPLEHLRVDYTGVRDLSPLRGMRLKRLELDYTPVTDLSPLEGMPLENIELDLKPYTGIEHLRAIPTLETINKKPAAEFWKQYDAKFGPPK